MIRDIKAVGTIEQIRAKAMNVGVYLCRCEGNISDVVNMAELEAFTKSLPNVSVVRTRDSACSDASQLQIVSDIKNEGLDRVVIACCSPHFHEDVFHRTLKDAGLNEYMMEIANVREQCSWVHYDDLVAATRKAKALVAIAVERVIRNELLEPLSVPIGKRALVIGAGIAGVQSAIELAEAGYNVVLVEKDPIIGGHMGQLSRTFPTNDCAPCILDPKLSDVRKNENIELHTYSEIENIEGSVGNFKVHLSKKPRYVDADRCRACGKCAAACPVKVPDEFNFEISERSAIYIPRVDCVPKAYLIDEKACLKCPKPLCVKACPMEGCITPPSRERTVEPKRLSFKVDCIVVATGYDLYDPTNITEYHYASIENLIHAGQMERMMIGTGPTLGAIKRPSDREPPKSIAFVLCAGSRDKNHMPYCSEVCCMYSMKQAFLARKQLGPEARITIFYTDIRAAGKGFEEYYNDVKDLGIEFIRGRPSDIMPAPNGNVLIRATDTILNVVLELEYELAVLAPAIVANLAAEPIVRMLKLPKSSSGFLKEAHPKYKPVDTRTSGVFVAGCALGPKDIRDSVTQGSAAASRAGRLLSRGRIEASTITAFVDKSWVKPSEEIINSCIFNAIHDDSGVIKVRPELCQGCGYCTSAVSPSPFSIKNFTHEQILAQVKAAVKTMEVPAIIAFLDDTCSYEAADILATRRTRYSSQIIPIRIPDGSIINVPLLLETLREGAAAVLVGTCEGNVNPYSSKCTNMCLENVAKVQEMLKPLHLERRVRGAPVVSGAPAMILANFQQLAAIVHEEGSTSEVDRAEIGKSLAILRPLM